LELPGASLGATRIENRADAGQPAFWAWWQSLLRGAPLPPAAGCPPLHAIDLFCGSGGLSLGADLAARAHGRTLRVRLAFDTDATALEVYRRNIRPEQVVNRSVAAALDYQLRTRRGCVRLAYPPRLVDDALCSAEGADLLIAGPPCQGHSNLNNFSRRDDPRNDLFVGAAVTGIALSVRAMVIENVPSVRNAREKVVEVSRRLLEDAGYRVAEAVLSADRLGWPQSRARLFMVAVRADEAPAEAATDEALAAFPWAGAVPRPVLWAIADLADLDGACAFDTAPELSQANRRRIDYLFEKNLYDLPDAERPDCHKNGTSYLSVYGRMRPDRPAQTITTGIGSPGQGRFIHPTRRRLITPHEAARIQGFPDWFCFSFEGREPSRKDLAKWIGEAVPPFLGFVVTSFALGALLGARPVGPDAVEPELPLKPVAAE
jgi:DNA (cytosine-5)-methyltransferase 1